MPPVVHEIFRVPLVSERCQDFVKVKSWFWARVEAKYMNYCEAM